MSEVALTPLKRAFLALERAQSRVAELERAVREPIAIIGMGCRVPGGADDPQSFWRLMRDEVDATGPIPATRWNADELYDPDPNAIGRIATRSGGFLGEVDAFDPEFFGIAPREAQGMDPQQRMLLEVGWEALEHAGCAPDRLQHSATGVYVGMCSSDYAYLQLMSQDASLLDAHFTSGIAHSIVSGRLSYLLGLQGPSLTIDTACSSSLVAVHLACQALRSGDCRMALAGGVNLILSPDLYIALSHSRMLAPDGRCKTFDAAADGFARGEGCGVVVLKRLSDAQADGDRVLAVIRGSAVNQDGPSSGLTAPNGPAQEAVIRAALAHAGITPREVGYLEAHGTGTQLGDPLEVHAIGAVFGPDRDPRQPLVLGSVKTNIGHLEAAAGITGLIKVVLALRERTIPAHLHFRTPSPHIAWGDWPLHVPTKLMPWPAIDGRRIAGISSFGFSGTNAHVVLEEAAGATATAVAEGLAIAASTAQLFAISARDERSLCELARRYAATLDWESPPSLADICFTTNTGRAKFGERATIIAHSLAELRAGLLALAAGEPAPGLRRMRVMRRDPVRIAFLFTGQGAQYARMAREVYAQSSVFREALDRCAELLRAHLPKPLLDVIFAEASTSELDQTVYTQPALFSIEYALTRLLSSWGITPNVVMGHSVGELTAACVAGVLGLEDALPLIAERGRLMQSLPAGGAMAAVFAPMSQVIPVVTPFSALVAIAAVNSADQVVISGSAEPVARICASLAAQGIRCQALAVSHAFHSPLVDPILDEFQAAAERVKFSPPRVRLISNLTGQVVKADDLTQPSYWRDHVRQPVRFGDGLRTLEALHVDCALEIGPHPALLSFARPGADGAPPFTLIPTLRKGRADWDQMLEAVASVFLTGGEIDWRAVAGLPHPRRVDLPTYPFQRERCWFKAKSPARDPGTRGRFDGLRGTRRRSASAEIIFESAVSAAEPAFVREHRVQNLVVVPATMYLDALMSAARQIFGDAPVCVEDITIKEAMLLDDDGAVRLVQTVCGERRSGEFDAVLSSTPQGAAPDDSWTRHVGARLCRRSALDQSGEFQDSLALARARCTLPVDVADFYANFVRLGLEFGSRFRSVRSLSAGDDQALGEIHLADDLRSVPQSFGMHPVLLDGCLQVLSAALTGEANDVLFLPIGVARYTLYGDPGPRCWSLVRVRPGGGQSRRADVRIFDAQGALAAELVDVQLKRVSRDALSRLGGRWLDDCLYEPRWDADLALPADVPPVSLDAAAQAVAEVLPTLRRAARLDDYDAFLPHMEALCANYVVQAFVRLGWAPQRGEVVDATELADRLGVTGRHRRLFSRLLSILEEAGFVRRRGSECHALKPLPEVDPEREREALAIKYPDAGAELELTGRVASRLAAALRGEQDPMELLFPGGSTQTAETIYRDSPTAQVFNGLMAEVMAGIGSLHARPASAPGRPLRILEIGGGTGGTTSHVLPRLPEHGVQYTFSDIGPLFVARARERFGSSPLMRFAVLNLENDLQSQGFAAGSFDVIIASNVIHATAKLAATLDRVKSLLAPGGVLAMLEVTAPQRWFDLTVGLTEGWWAFEDHELRPDYATLSRQRWLELLSDRGFESAVALPGGTQRGVLGLQSLLLARAPPAMAQHRDWVIFADESGVGPRLAGRLRDRGDRCTLVHVGDRFEGDLDRLRLEPGASEHYRRLFTELQAGGRKIHGVVHAWTPDASGWPPTVSGLLLTQALGAGTTTSPPRLWFITHAAQHVEGHNEALNAGQAAIWGFCKTVALEMPELKCVCIDLPAAAAAGDVDDVLNEIHRDFSESQIAFRAGQRRLARLRRIPQTPPRPAEPEMQTYRLAAEPRGALERLVLHPLERRAPGRDEVEIAVEATALNFKDVLNVLGMYPGDPGPVGGECAGRIIAIGPGITHLRPGDDVIAIAAGSFASHVTARGEFVQLRPAGMSVEEGASIPIAYLTAEFCLGHLAKLRAGERVLIHAAAGGVGMAAVRLAQSAGAEVFATAGSAEKRELLRTMGVQHVFDSRNGSFVREIMDATAARGVDVILNSLSGELIDASFAVLTRGGRFVEIGKRGIKSQEWVDSQQRQTAYFVVDWGDTAEREPAVIGAMLARIVADIREGRLVSLPRHVFALQDVQGAFRFMAQARHAGKIVVRHGPPTPGQVRRDGSYLITGGLSGLGLLIARRLAGNGAGRLILVGRRGVTAEAVPVLDEMRALGVPVIVQTGDVGDEAMMKKLLALIRKDGPALRGVVHSAGVLKDAGLLQLDAEKFSQVLHPKVDGGMLLDRLTRSDPIDWFVLFSSVAAVLGSPGQANHSAANAVLDALAHARRNEGLPGISINWGAWSGVGAAADRGIAERLSALGIGSLTPEQGLSAWERILAQAHGQIAVLPIDWRIYLRHIARSSALRFFDCVADMTAGTSPIAAPRGGETTPSDTRLDFKQQLEAAPPGRRRSMIGTLVREQALRTLGLDANRNLDPRMPMGELGLDSLLAVELRNSLGGALDRSLPATLLFDFPTLETLTEYLLVEVLGAEPPAPVGAEPAPKPSLVASIEDLSDEEVERQLAARAQGKR